MQNSYPGNHCRCRGEKLKEVVRSTRSGKVPDVHRTRCMRDVRFFIGESIAEMRLVS